MKKINIALLVSSIVFAASAILVSCGSANDKNSSTPDKNIQQSTSAAETTAETTENNKDKTETTAVSATASSEKNTENKISETEPAATAAPTNAATEAPSQANTQSGSEPDATETASATQPATENNEAELLEKAQTLYDTACETNWNFHVGCPYSLSSEYVENQLGWQFWLITSEGVNSMDDVRRDYHKVFSSSYPDDLDEIFMESNGRVYALAGERGSDIFYTGSKVVSVDKVTDTEITFTVENYYSGDDMDLNTPVTKENTFSAVIESDGTWRAGEFTLPY